MSALKKFYITTQKHGVLVVKLPSIEDVKKHIENKKSWALANDTVLNIEKANEDFYTVNDIFLRLQHLRENNLSITTVDNRTFLVKGFLCVDHIFADIDGELVSVATLDEDKRKWLATKGYGKDIFTSVNRLVKEKSNFKFAEWFSFEKSSMSW